jgi:hypothetical protein
MKMESIVIHATKEAKQKWAGKKIPQKDKKIGCPSCEIEALKKKNAEIFHEE